MTQAGLLVVVPCGQGKIWDRYPAAGPTPARDVYTGAPSKVNRAFAEYFGARWVILSAKYGFVDPDFVIPEPYNLTFRKRDPGLVTPATLREQVENLQLAAYPDVIVLGGKEYQRVAREALSGTGVTPHFPFAGLPMGAAMAATNEAIRRGDPFYRETPAGRSGRSLGFPSVSSATVEVEVAAMNDKDKFMQALDSACQPSCDDCLTELVSSWGQRQRANAAGRRLVAEGRISRSQGECCRCGRTKVVSARAGAVPTQQKLPRSGGGNDAVVPRGTDLSAEKILARMKKDGVVEPGGTWTDVSALGPKGEKRFYVQVVGENLYAAASCEADDQLPAGAKEITWEQACELVIYLKVKAEFTQKAPVRSPSSVKGRAFVPESARRKEFMDRALPRLSTYAHIVAPAGTTEEPKAKEIWSDKNRFYLADYGEESQLVVVLAGVALELPEGAAVEELSFSEAQKIDHLRHAKELNPNGVKKKNHGLFWMLFAYASLETSKSISKFLKTGGR